MFDRFLGARRLLSTDSRVAGLPVDVRRGLGNILDTTLVFSETLSFSPTGCVSKEDSKDCR